MGRSHYFLEGALMRAGQVKKILLCRARLRPAGRDRWQRPGGSQKITSTFFAAAHATGIFGGYPGSGGYEISYPGAF